MARPANPDLLLTGRIIHPITNCWISQRVPTNYRGYVRIMNRYQHRLAYERFIGPIPLGYQIDHLCRNPSCFNPEHLEAVLPSENVRRGLSPQLTRERHKQKRESNVS